jgi:hypothetical protein
MGYRGSVVDRVSVPRSNSCLTCGMGRVWRNSLPAEGKIQAVRRLLPYRPEDAKEREEAD